MPEFATTIKQVDQLNFSQTMDFLFNTPIDAEERDSLIITFVNDAFNRLQERKPVKPGDLPVCSIRYSIDVSNFLANYKVTEKITPDDLFKKYQNEFMTQSDQRSKSKEEKEKLFNEKLLEKIKDTVNPFFQDNPQYQQMMGDLNYPPSYVCDDLLCSFNIYSKKVEISAYIKETQGYCSLM